MNSDNKIIAIRKKDVALARKEFTKLLQKTEDILNRTAIQKPDYFRDVNSNSFEIISCNTIKTACENTPFDSNEVFLVSGKRFPDIVTNKYYGIEVKSTISNHWVTTGSSILESSRIADVEDIFVLFGKLGGDIPQFRCRPYQDVMADISLTHSPRYRIDMNLNENETIFKKMNIDYDTFRRSPDAIKIVRNYYKQEAIKKGTVEMPWWITTHNAETPLNINVRLWNTIPIEEKKKLCAMCMILFPESLYPTSNSTKYNRVALWLCSYAQVVNPHIRDLYSAGGRIIKVNNLSLKKPVSQVFNKMVEMSDYIKTLLQNLDPDMQALIEEYNPELLKNSDVYQAWTQTCASIAKNFDVPILQWIDEKPMFVFSK